MCVIVSLSYTLYNRELFVMGRISQTLHHRIAHAMVLTTDMNNKDEAFGIDDILETVI